MRNVRANCSDPHHGGRTVIVLEFEPDGSRLVYKPKDLRIEQAFGRLIDWINALGDLPPLKAPQVLLRESYGWAEFIARERWAGAEQEAGHHRRAGMLLSIVHMLGGVDMHSENLISSGEHPVVIDLETVMSPHFRKHAGPTANAAPANPRDSIAAELSQSILRTGLLPFWRFGPDGRLHNQSGLKDDGVGSFTDRAAELCAGFTSLYELILQNREALIGPRRSAA